MKPTITRAAIGGVLAIVMLVVAVRGTRATAVEPAGVVVPTQHNDNQRTGANLGEALLTPQLLRSNGLHGVDRAVDGMINTQILYAHGVTVHGKPRNVAYVTTSANSVYAYDADVTSNGLQDGFLWRAPLVDPAPAVARGISATPVLEFANGGGTIDVLYSTATNAVPFGKLGGGTFSGNIGSELALRKSLTMHFYLVKLDLATGKPVGSPAEIRDVSAVRDDNVPVTFDPIQENDVASLLLDHGYLYVSFSARQNENTSQYYGWLLRYKATDLSYAGAFNAAPHAWDWKGAQLPQYYPTASRATGTACYGPSGWQPPPPEPAANGARHGTATHAGAAATTTQPVGRLKPWDLTWTKDLSAMACTGEGAGIWQGGAGPAADRDGNVYVMTGNGHYDPKEGSYGDSIVRLHSKGGGSSPADFGVDRSWAPPAEMDTDEQNDVDLGSAGPLVVDELGPAKRVLVGGKTGVFYVVDGRQLALKQSVTAGDVAGVSSAEQTWMRYQTWEEGPHLHGSPTYWRVSPNKAYVYEWAEKDYLKRYDFDPAQGKFTFPHPNVPWSAKAQILAPPCVLDKILRCLNVMPGGMLALSARGTNEDSGVVWAIVHGYFPWTADAIYAFDSKKLGMLWHDDIGAVPHFAGPTVADGHVFVPTNSMQWRFTIYSPGRSRTVRASHRQPPAAFAQPLTALAKARTMRMTRSHAAGISVPDYAADPAFRARLGLATVTQALPPGMIVGGSYVALGTDTYQCSSASACVHVKTDVTRIAHFDDRTGVGAEIPLEGVCSYPAAAVGAPILPSSPDWQFLKSPCPVFGSASYVGRAWSVFLPPAAAHTGAVPFIAIYFGLQQGAT